MNKKHSIELRNSLRRRGFWGSLTDGEFVLDKWYSNQNYYEMVNLLAAVHLDFEVDLRGIRIISDSVTDERLDRIESICRNDLRYIQRIRRFVLPKLWEGNNQNDLQIIDLDAGIGSLVFSLNKVGFQTSMSCDGHGNREPNVWSNHQEDIKSINALLLKAAQEISLAYDWEIEKKIVGFTLTAKRRLKSDIWDVKKIQDDAYGLSKFLLNNINN